MNDSSFLQALLIALAVMIPIALLVGLIGYILTSIFLMKLFEKAGVQGKWRAWVPFYREMIFFKLGDLNPWWYIVMLAATAVLGAIPFIGEFVTWILALALAVYSVLAGYRIGEKLQKEWPWLILYVLLWIVWLGIMAFGSSRWNTGVRPAPWANSFLADKTRWDGIPDQQGGAAAPGAYPPPAPPAPGV